MDNRPGTGPTDLPSARVMTRSAGRVVAPPIGQALPGGDRLPVVLARHWREWAGTLQGWRSVALACALTLALHLLFLSPQLTIDEGGFAMVARTWRSAGPYLYGQQWVDRPPGLMVMFEAAQVWGPLGLRVAAGLCATLLVAASAWAAGAARGQRAAGWAAWTAFALATSPMLDAYELNGEIIAAALVMVAVASAMTAMYRDGSARRLVLLGLLSGASATGALLVKQNFADGLVFVGVLLAAGAMLRSFPLPRLLPAIAGVLVGAALPLALTARWAMSHHGVKALMYAMYGFRAAAGDVIADHSWHAPEMRLLDLVWLAFASGMLLLAGQLVLSQRRALLSRSPLVWAVTAATGVELVGVVLGANYWPHYLIAPIPMLALVAGIASTTTHTVSPAAGERGRLWTRSLVGVAVLTTLLSAPVGAVQAHTHRSSAYALGRWLASSAAHHDTVVVPFTHSNVIQASGLTSPYPYSWSLPVRTLDPGLTLLTHVLDRRRGAPTWVVRWDPPHSWGLDPRDHISRALETHYREVAVVCGHPVWLHHGLHRALAPVPRRCGGSHPVAAFAPSGTGGSSQPVDRSTPPRRSSS